MNALKDALVRAARDLELAGLDFALVGGLAVSVRAQPRLTRDVDLAVAAHDDRAAERAVWQLQQRGFRVGATIEHRPSGRLATARLRDPEDRVLVDLLFASCGIEPEIVAAAEAIEVLEGVRLPVALAGHLIAMKVLAHDDRRRPQDHDDIRALVEAEGDRAVVLARDALDLITARGFHRQRDLRQSLETLLRTS